LRDVIGLRQRLLGGLRTRGIALVEAEGASEDQRVRTSGAPRRALQHLADQRPHRVTVAQLVVARGRRDRAAQEVLAAIRRCQPARFIEQVGGSEDSSTCACALCGSLERSGDVLVRRVRAQCEVPRPLFRLACELGEAPMQEAPPPRRQARVGS
jgi:hypothetical protein